MRQFDHATGTDAAMSEYVERLVKMEKLAAASTSGALQQIGRKLWPRAAAKFYDQQRKRRAATAKKKQGA